jgi:hypothetical protein
MYWLLIALLSWGVFGAASGWDGGGTDFQDNGSLYGGTGIPPTTGQQQPILYGGTGIPPTGP